MLFLVMAIVGTVLLAIGSVSSSFTKLFKLMGVFLFVTTIAGWILKQPNIISVTGNSGTQTSETASYACDITEGGLAAIHMPNGKMEYLDTMDNIEYHVDDSLDHLVYRKTETVYTPEPVSSFDRIMFGIIFYNDSPYTEVTSETILGPKSLLHEFRDKINTRKNDSPKTYYWPFYYPIFF